MIRQPVFAVWEKYREGRIPLMRSADGKPALYMEERAHDGR